MIFKLLALTVLLSAALPASAAAQEKAGGPQFKVSLKRPARGEAQKAGAGAASQGASGAGGQEVDEEEVVRVETSLVTCDVHVLDRKGRAARGLTAKDFVVTEEGVPQEIGTFSLGDNASLPRSIVLIIDYSGSQLPYIENGIRAAQTLVEQLNPRDRMAVVADDVELLVEFTRDKTLLKNSLESLLKKARSDRPAAEESSVRAGGADFGGEALVRAGRGISSELSIFGTPVSLSL